jgi:hypothetical protein
MENTGFKGIMLTLWQRIILSYKSSLIGLVVMVVGYFVEVYAPSPNKIISTVATIVGGLLMFYKEQNKVPAPPAP